MSDKPDSDFERACAAFYETFNGREPGAWAALTAAGGGKQARRGMLAALREMRELSDAQWRVGEHAWMNRDLADPFSEPIRDNWQAMLDELIRQGEQ